MPWSAICIIVNFEIGVTGMRVLMLAMACVAATSGIITAPSGAAGTLQTATHCGGQAMLFSDGVGDQMVGADPIIGDAGSLSCEILDGLLTDSGTAGDGHDVNCLTRASALP
ncbi:hypothetical protein ABQF34_07050 [Mycolicibacterium boenickei]